MFPMMFSRNFDSVENFELATHGWISIGGVEIYDATGSLQDRSGRAKVPRCVGHVPVQRKVVDKV